MRVNGYNSDSRHLAIICVNLLLALWLDLGEGDVQVVGTA